MELGIIMDPISEIEIKKDSSFAMLLAAQKRGWNIHYMELDDLYMDNEKPRARMQSLTVEDNSKEWHNLTNTHVDDLSVLDIILMRKDPPFNLEYIYSTYILEHAHRLGTCVVNNPASLRTVNEKFYITYFPECIAPTLISRDIKLLTKFVQEQGDIIVKPLDGMGGIGIHRINKQDDNIESILKSMRKNGSEYVMGQKFLPDIVAGDKRVLLIDGKPIPYALARVPSTNNSKGNLAQGAIGKGIELTKRDKWICEKVGPKLREMGLIFVGIDIIGDYLTEINVTSPTCIRELDNIYDLKIAEQLMDVIDKKRKEHR